jgi:hypothetical protein
MNFTDAERNELLLLARRQSQLLEIMNIHLRDIVVALETLTKQRKD